MPAYVLVKNLANIVDVVMPHKRVIIVGGGIGGLATACLLADAGYDVTIHESRHQLGGRVGSFTEAGFTFDTGPSWYLMPEVFDRFFGLLGKKPSDFLQLKRLSPAYKVFFANIEIQVLEVILDRTVSESCLNEWTSVHVYLFVSLFVFINNIKILYMFMFICLS